MASQPTDLDGLRKLYFTEFVPLYDYLCSKLENLPSELHFEVTAAFDHVMRAGLEYDGRKFEAENYAKASGHLKRATFDAFKLLYKYTMRPLWKKLTRSRYESVPGFVEKVRGEWYKAKVLRQRRHLRCNWRPPLETVERRTAAPVLPVGKLPANLAFTTVNIG